MMTASMPPKKPALSGMLWYGASRRSRISLEPMCLCMHATVMLMHVWLNFATLIHEYASTITWAGGALGYETGELHVTPPIWTRYLHSSAGQWNICMHAYCRNHCLTYMHVHVDNCTLYVFPIHAAATFVTNTCVSHTCHILIAKVSGNEAKKYAAWKQLHTSHKTNAWNSVSGLRTGCEPACMENKNAHTMQRDHVIPALQSEHSGCSSWSLTGLVSLKLKTACMYETISMHVWKNNVWTHD